MKHIIVIVFLIPNMLLGQSGKGISFKQFSNWEQVKQEAKSKQKYIFVDCYATWCIPCKRMDKLVYTNDTVGAFMNDKYISIKVQIDTSKVDNDEIKNWYSVGHHFVSDYSITGFPTFLFFSPDGEIVHKQLGSKTVPEFITMASSALNENEQVYTLVRKYKEGKIDYPSMKKLANNLKELGDDGLALQVAKEYMHHYLDKLPLNEFATIENMELLKNNYKMWVTTDRIFELFYNNPQMVDSITRDVQGTAFSFVNYLVYKEQVIVKLDEAKKNISSPNWKEITRNIKTKYPKVRVTEMIIKAKMSWYKFKEDWEDLCKYQIQQIEIKGLENFASDAGSVVALNGAAWNIFLYSTNKKYLKKAILWIEKGIEITKKNNHNLTASLMDTKANLIYKLGNKVDAIELAKEVVKMQPIFRSTLEKMENGIPTWIKEDTSN